jgi:pyruvate dehydrogenase E2 component (dihydrolipoamide acetyltransferase)
VIGVIGGKDEEIDFEAIQAAKVTPEDAEEEETSATGSKAPSETSTDQGTVAGRSTTGESSRLDAGPVTTTAGPAIAIGSRPAHRLFASPLARKIALERGVALENLSGTGPRGRILRRDVERAPVGGNGQPSEKGVVAFDGGEKPYPPPSPRPPSSVPLEKMRRAIANALQQSKQNIPHFYATVSIDVSAALERRQIFRTQGAKISINDMVVRGCAIALQDEPRVNCRVSPDHIEYPSDVNIGIAVGSDEGLLVPVVLRAQSLDLPGTASESRRVIEAASAGKLIGSGQGTFTISNLGMFGVESFTAIINPPEGAILAVGAVRTEVIPRGGGFLPRAILKVTLSSDHRAIDGLIAARFLARLKHLLEHPERL